MPGELGAMPKYGVAHIIVLVLIVGLCVLAVVGGRKLRQDPEEERRVTQLLGWFLMVVGVGWLIYDLSPLRFTIWQSLPLHFTDLLRVMVPLALLTRWSIPILISYYWGLVLNFMAIVTPDLVYVHSVSLEFAAYWISHSAALVVPIFLVWGLGYRPTWRGYGAMLLVTVLWSALAMTVNAALDTNYGYLSAVPPSGSILDLFGGWPTYLIWAGSLLAGAWALMTWPWTKPAHRGEPIDRWGLVTRKVAPRG